MFCGSAVQLCPEVTDRCGGLSNHVRNLSRTVAAVVAMYGYDFCDYLWLSMAQKQSLLM